MQASQLSGNFSFDEGSNAIDCLGRPVTTGIPLFSDQEPYRNTKQGATSNSSAIGDHTAEFDSAAGREVLPGFYQNAQDKHGEACGDSSPPVAESDHGQRSQRQVSTKMPYLVVDVQATDLYHRRRCGG